MFTRSTVALLLAGLAVVPALMYERARGSDHNDTPAIAARPGVDLTDVYVFPSTDPNKVVLAMCVHPLIPSGQGPSATFDPNVLYQFKIDNTGDFVEDQVIQFRFSGTAANQVVSVAGPAVPTRTGTVSTLLRPDPTTGTINIPFTTTNGLRVFAGAREDPFFFDLDAFLKILPDRGTPLNPTALPAGQNPNAAQFPSFLAARNGRAPQDFLAGLNVLAIVVELNRSQLTGSGNGTIGVWCTTSI